MFLMVKIQFYLFERKIKCLVSHAVVLMKTDLPIDVSITTVGLIDNNIYGIYNNNYKLLDQNYTLCITQLTRLPGVKCPSI